MSVIGSVEPTFGRALRETGSLSIIDTRAPESIHAIRSPRLAWAGLEQRWRLASGGAASAIRTSDRIAIGLRE